MVLGHLGNMDSSKVACAVENITLFGPHMKMYPFPPEWFPRKVMSSALGASSSQQE